MSFLKMFTKRFIRKVFFSRNIVYVNKQCLFSTGAHQIQQEERLLNFRTTEINPLNHTISHTGQFYKISANDKGLLFTHGGIPKSFELQSKTFNETCFMIREPSIDITNCLKTLDYTKPAPRFVLYGKKGSGKSLTLAHTIHFASKSGFLIVHIPWVGNWMRRCKEVSNSDTKEGFVNLNIDAAAWLVHFKTQNSQLLNDSILTVSEDYAWTKREKTAKGSNLLELIDFGINRIKFASDCVVVLAEEIKRLSRAGKCKTLVAIDGFNAFFYPKTRVFKEKKEVVPPEKVILTEAFLNLTKFDWNNAAIVTTVDELAIAEEDHKSHLPRYLLGKEGFDHLDPFVPIFINNYTPKEFLSCMEYYRERKWITAYEQQDEELKFLSNQNPFKLMELCRSL